MFDCAGRRKVIRIVDDLRQKFTLFLEFGIYVVLWGRVREFGTLLSDCCAKDSLKCGQLLKQAIVNRQYFSRIEEIGQINSKRFA